jgi:hypothetical protein
MTRVQVVILERRKQEEEAIMRRNHVTLSVLVLVRRDVLLRKI